MSVVVCIKKKSTILCTVTVADVRIVLFLLLTRQATSVRGRHAHILTQTDICILACGSWFASHVGAAPPLRAIDSPLRFYFCLLEPLPRTCVQYFRTTSEQAHNARKWRGIGLLHSGFASRPPII
jgi:hypothetical protein